MQKEIELNRIKKKNTHSSVQFPHGFYVELIDQLAKEIRVYPSYDHEDESIKSKFNNTLIIPAQFTFNEKRENSLLKIDEVQKLTNDGVNIDICC